MKFLALFLSISIVFCGNVKGSDDDILEWPMFQEGNELYFQLKIGTPSQTINVSMRHFQSNQGLEIVPKSLGGEFDDDASLSWFYRDGFYEKSSKKVRYWENIEIRNQKFYQLPFGMKKSPSKYKASLGFALNNDNPFWVALFKQTSSSMVTIAFDKYPQNGSITIGLNKKLCYDDWQILNMDVIKHFDADETRFGLDFSNVSTGKDDYFIAKGQIVFDINDDSTVWPTSYYYRISRNLGTKDNLTIPCDSKDTLNFDVGGMTLTLEPEDYIDRDLPDGKCRLIGLSVTPKDGNKRDEIWLSKSLIFKKHCVAFDQVNKKLGFATRRNVEKKKINVI